MVTVVARWKVKSENLDTVLNLSQILVGETQKEPGNLKYDLYQKNKFPNEILIFEIYKSMEDFEFHKNTSHFKEIAMRQIIPLLEERELDVF